MESVFKKPSESDRNVNASLYLGNLDPQVTELILYELLIQVAPVKSINLPKDKILRTHQGFGFVEFKNANDTDYVLSILRGIRIYGRALKIRKVEPHKNNQNPQALSSGQQIDNVEDIDVGAKLFVKHLNPLIDEKFLLDTFSRFGKVIGQPSIVRDSITSESKGYGFVTFSDFNTSDEVIDIMNGVSLMNSKVDISYAFKEDPVSGQKKHTRHGDKVERKLAESAKSNNFGKPTLQQPPKGSRSKRPISSRE